MKQYYICKNCEQEFEGVSPSGLCPQCLERHMELAHLQNMARWYNEKYRELATNETTTKEVES